jgi:uncharacterized membrane protein YoaK (UPF0700 family)
VKSNAGEAVNRAAQTSADREPPRRAIAPAFEHVAFPVGLGFVAGFVDVFGFMALLGLLPAHVTGNLIFLAFDLARHQYNVAMKIAALPIFAASVAVAAWLIGTLSASGRHPFLPMVLLQAAALGLSLVAGLLLPKPAGPDDLTVFIVGSMMLFAMALQNTVMRLILNNLPPTTIMTGNITHMVAEGVRLAAGFGAAMTPAEKETLAYRARRIGLALASFTIGAIAGGLAQARFGYVALLAPIAVLLALLPVGQSELRATAKF